MDVQKYRTFAFLWRPRNGADSVSHDNSVLEWIRKRSTHYHVVAEKKGSERHLHACLYLKTEVTRSNFSLTLVRLGKQHDLDLEELTVLRKGVRIMYSNDFITKYLTKDADSEVIGSCLPEVATLEAFYPPKVVEAKTKKPRHSLFYWELEKLWYEHRRPCEEVNTVNVRSFLFRMMYKDRLIAVIRDDRAIVQTARHLTRFLNKSENSTIEIPAFEKEE